MTEEREFCQAMETAKRELKRAVAALSHCRLYGSGETSRQILRVNAARESILNLKSDAVYLRMVSKRNAEKRALKKIRDKRYKEAHREKLKELAKVAAAKRRASGADAAYRSRPDVHARIIGLKEKYRRISGAVPRHEISARADERAAAREARRNAKADFFVNFIGPPTPSKSMTDAEYYQWRVLNDPSFYMRELDRAQRYKARTRSGYKDSRIKWADMPAALQEVKHLQFLISRQIKRS